MSVRYPVLENRDDIQKMWAEGCSIKRICYAFDLKEHALLSYISQHRDLFPYRRKPMDQDTLDEIAQMWSEGTTVIQIADFTGYAAISIRRALRKMGLME